MPDFLQKRLALKPKGPSVAMCNACGALNGNLTLSDREWDCDCGAHHQRDFLAMRIDAPAGQPVAYLSKERLKHGSRAATDDHDVATGKTASRPLPGA